MAQDRSNAEQDLAAVHRFYIALVERKLGHEVPLPQAVRAADSAGAASGPDLELLRRWLNLLDLATAPVLVRDALKDAATYEMAEALLRFYVTRASAADENRDKADFVATYLFRSKFSGGGRAPAEYEGTAFYAAEETAAFEKELERILGDHPAPELPAEHRHLVSEFNFIRQEVEEFRDFDRMMDAGVVQRVREIKQSFGQHFYHPAVLATVAAYNAFFGRRFDELFRKASEQIKRYAERVQQEGGSIMSRVDGDVLLKDLTEVEESRIMSQEYGQAQEQFRRVSRYKKAVESRKGRGPAAAASAGATPLSADRMVSSASNAGWREGQGKAARATSDEDGHIRAMQDSIRSFVRGARPGPLVMPLRGGSITLNAAEADAFRSEHAEEKSFRGQYVNLVMRCLATQARMIVETAEYHTHKNTAYLWKAPADALAAQLAAAQTVMNKGQELAQTAQQRGLAGKADTILAAGEKLRAQSESVAGLLRNVPVR